MLYPYHPLQLQMLFMATFVVLLTALHHAVLSDVTATSAQSPLFGSTELGKPFDDGTLTVTPPVIGLQSLRIIYGPFIFSIQATYLLENGGKFSGNVHGMIRPSLTIHFTDLNFKDGERIQRITGTLDPTYGFITMLKLYANDSKESFKVYGPFGIKGSCDIPFTILGSVTGLFGRSSKYLNALGAYINPLVTPVYNRTKMVGGIYGVVFDDYPALSSGAEMLNITINSGGYIFRLSITYRFPNGTLFIASHGQPSSNSIINNVIRFNNGERIVQTDLAIFSLFVNYLVFETLDSRGVRRVYGPFGDVPQSDITKVHGTVYGFYGRVGMDHNITALTGLGFYI